MISLKKFGSVQFFESFGELNFRVVIWGCFICRGTLTYEIEESELLPSFASLSPKSTHDVTPRELLK